MDLTSFAKVLGGAKRLEGSGANRPTNVSRIAGTAISDSADGKVLVDLDAQVFSGDGSQYVELDTSDNVRKGDRVYVDMVGADGKGKSLMISGATGSGDRQQGEIDSAAKAAEAAWDWADEAHTAATDAQASASAAQESASSAASAASSAVSSAARAEQSASQAIADAAAASAAATAAQGSADSAAESARTAQQTAEAAQRSANTAQGAANAAQTSANAANAHATAALNSLSTVEDVVDTLTWITEHGTMAKTTDTAVDPSKVYFVRDNNGDYTVGGNRYSIVQEPVASDLSSYHELTIDKSVENYIATHLSVTNEGLWLTPTESGGYRVLVATGGAGKTYPTAGTYIIDGSGKTVAQFTGTGISFADDRTFFIGDESAYIFFDGNGHINIGGSNVTIGGSTTLAELLAKYDATITSDDISVSKTGGTATITVGGDTVTISDGAAGAQGPKGDTGDQGPQGPKGNDGTSVTVSRVEYGTSASASTQPSSWSTTVPSSIAKGQWLWVKTSYSDGTDATTKSYVGTDGEDGTSVFVQSATKSGDTTTVVIADSEGHTSTLTIKDGTDGTNGTNGQNGLTGYVHTAWANSADGRTDFSTTASAGKSYLGVYTDNTAADSQTYSDYSWSLIKGAKGDQGETGPQGPAGHSPAITTSKNSDGSVTIYVDGTATSTVDAGEDGQAPTITTAKNSDGSVTIYVNGTASNTVEAGADGTSYYTYVRYSANASGSGMVATPTSATKYIGVYTGTSSSVPAYTSFKWSKYVGEDGSDADPLTVTSHAVDYQLSTSGTTAPTGTWSTTPLAPTTTQYLWTRTTLKFSDSTESVSYSVGGKAGTNGQNGTNGTNGTDGGRWYAGTKITGTSTTATVFSGSGISAAVVGDMYLNTSTYNTYRCTVAGNASTAKWAYVANIKGQAGAQGPQGETGPQGPQGPQGEKGSAGANGVSITGVEHQYYLSTSSTSQAGGSWTVKPAAYVRGRYYWERWKVSFSSGNPTYTTATLAEEVTSAWTAIEQNDEQIALKANSSDVYTKSAVDGKITQEVADRNAAITAKANEITSSVSETYTTKQEFADLEIGGRNLFSWPVSGTKWKDEAHELNAYQNRGSFTQFTNSLQFDPLETIGEEYTISFDVRSPNGPTNVAVYNSNSNPSAFYFVSTYVATNVGDEWVHCERTITNAAHEGGNAAYNRRIEIYAPSAMGVLVRKIKVEKGNKATDWTPAPEDIETRVSSAESSITQNAQNIELRVTKTEFESLEIGGRNLLFLTRDFETKSGSTTGGYLSGVSLGTRVPIVSETYKGLAVRHFTTSEIDASTYYELAYADLLIPISGKSYIFSFYAKGTGKVRTHFYPNTSGGTIKNTGSQGQSNTATDGAVDFTVSSDWQRFWVRFEIGGTQGTNARHALLRVFGGNDIFVCGLKFEEGTKATDWTPAPEDIDARVTAAEASIEVNADNIALKANSSDVYTKTEVSQMAQPNLSPFFSMAPTNAYNATTNPDGYWDTNKASGWTLEQLADGWVHIDFSNTGTSTRWFTIYEHCAWRHRAGDLKGSTKYTVMFEFRNVTKTGSVTCIGMTQVPTSWPSMFIGNSEQGNVSVADGVQYHVGTTVTDPASVTGNACTTRTLISFPAGSSLDAEFRVSLYEGEYAGPYKPYSGDMMYATKSELKVTTDSISTEVAKKVNGTEIISSINQSAETVKIQASKVEIDGTAVFSAIRSDVDDAITSKGYATTTQAQGYATTAKSEAISAAATDATTKANAAQTAATNAANTATDNKLKSYSTTQQVNAKIQDATGPLFYGRENSSGYIHLGHVPYTVSSTSNYSHFHLTGRIGGWLSTTSGSIDVTFKSRGDNALYNTVDRRDEAISTSFVDVLVYTGTDNFTHYWLKVNSYWYAQLYAEFEQFVEDDHTLTATEPDGTCVWKLSEHTAVAATKSDAVKRTQRIWYRKSASGAPATPGTASSNWVTKADDGDNAWTKMHVAISSSAKYIYTCEQYEMADGTVGYTSVLLDNTITVIDGGNIITGTVTANKLNASDINASKKLTVGAMTDAAASTILNSNVQVGGRNLLIGSSTGAGWYYSTFDKSSVTYTRSTTATTESTIAGPNMTFEAGETYTLSCLAKSNGNVTSMDLFKVHVSGSGSHQSRNNISLTNEYQKIVWTFTCNATSDEVAVIRFDNNGSRTSGTEAILYVKEPKLEKGNKATDWTPAPEDVDADISKAAQTATNYVTEVNGDGVWVTPSNAKPVNGAAASTTSGWHISSAIELFRAGVSMLKAWVEGTTTKVRIGAEAAGHIVLDPDGISFRDAASDVAHIARRTGGAILSIGRAMLGEGQNAWLQAYTENSIVTCEVGASHGLAEGSGMVASVEARAAAGVAQVYASGKSLTVADNYNSSLMGIYDVPMGNFGKLARCRIDIAFGTITVSANSRADITLAWQSGGFDNGNYIASVMPMAWANGFNNVAYCVSNRAADKVTVSAWNNNSYAVTQLIGVIGVDSRYGTVV